MYDLDLATLQWVSKHISLEIKSIREDDDNFSKEEQEVVLRRIHDIVKTEIINALSKPNKM